MNQIRIPKTPVWEKLIEHYYEHIHFQEYPRGDRPSICDWLEKDYGAETSRWSENICFKSETQASHFLLKWS